MPKRGLSEQPLKTDGDISLENRDFGNECKESSFISVDDFESSKSGDDFQLKKEDADDAENETSEESEIDDDKFDGVDDAASFSATKHADIDFYDSSDEEDLRNTIGNIPVSWYDDQHHIGYDMDGKKIEKSLVKSEIDQFLEKVDDPDYWRKIRDKQTGRNAVLTDEQIATLDNIKRGKYPTIGYNPYQPFIDFVSSQVEIHPISNRPPDKRSFQPSIDERRMVGRMVRAIKMGWARPKKPPKSDTDNNIDLWKTEDDEKSRLDKSKNQLARIKMHMSAPKVPLPSHAESYNPPSEYLLTKEELSEWESCEPEDRRRDFVPLKFASLRQVPGYSRFINDRFERCLDLFLAPRLRKDKLNIDPNSLLPKLPKPQDLRPFPTTLVLTLEGHTDIVRTVSIEPSIGQLLASGSDDCTVKVWEIGTGRCIRTFPLNAPIRTVAWCSDPKRTLLTVVLDSCVLLLNSQSGDRLLVNNTENALKGYCQEMKEHLNVAQGPVTWSIIDDFQNDSMTQLKLIFENKVKQVSWHGRGDYFATVSDGVSRSVAVHQLSKLKSQTPFKKNKGSVQCVAFHPCQPWFFVATQRHIRIYNLAKLQLVKKLTSNCRWISSMAIHPNGDNLIIGSYDCRLCWFDLDLSSKPYKTFRHHKGAIRNVCFHPRLPLFSSCSDDGSSLVYHGRVYADLLQNPQIVPVKMLRGHGQKDGFSILASIFHPKRPWLITAGADARLALYIY